MTANHETTPVSPLRPDRKHVIINRQTPQVSVHHPSVDSVLISYVRAGIMESGGSEGVYNLAITDGPIKKNLDISHAQVTNIRNREVTLDLPAMGVRYTCVLTCRSEAVARKVGDGLQSLWAKHTIPQMMTLYTDHNRRLLGDLPGQGGKEKRAYSQFDVPQILGIFERLSPITEGQDWVEYWEAVPALAVWMGENRYDCPNTTGACLLIRELEKDRYIETVTCRPDIAVTDLFRVRKPGRIPMLHKSLLAAVGALRFALQAKIPTAELANFLAHFTLRSVEWALQDLKFLERLGIIELDGSGNPSWTGIGTIDICDDLLPHVTRTAISFDPYTGSLGEVSVQPQKFTPLASFDGLSDRVQIFFEPVRQARSEYFDRYKQIKEREYVEARAALDAAQKSFDLDKITEANKRMIAVVEELKRCEAEGTKLLDGLGPECDKDYDEIQGLLTQLRKLLEKYPGIFTSIPETQIPVNQDLWLYLKEEKIDPRTIRTFQSRRPDMTMEKFTSLTTTELRKLGLGYTTAKNLFSLILKLRNEQE